MRSKQVYYLRILIDYFFSIAIIVTIISKKIRKSILKRVIVSDFKTGAAIIFGATGGIGRVVCLELARAGSNIAIVWNSKGDVAASLQAEIQAMGRKATTHQCDVTHEGASDVTVKAAAKAHGQLHTCLLYTSPSPRDATLSRMPSSA